MPNKPTPVADPRQTESWRKADDACRAQWQQYCQACGVSEEQLYWMLRLRELNALTPEERRAANRGGENAMVGAIVVFLVAAGSRNPVLLLVACAALFSTAFFYLSGRTSPHTMALRQAKKQLAQYPQAPDLDEWCRAQQQS